MREQADRQESILWVDLIRVVGIYLVVVAHVSGQLTSVWGEIPTGQWMIANVYGGIARACVPLFFMISGYLLLPRSESLSAFYARRLPKILIPLIVWSLIYLGWYCENHPNTCAPTLVWNLLLVEGTSYHLWFLYTLLGMYLVLPVLRLMIRLDTDKSILWYFIGLWLFFQFLAIAHKLWNFSINLSAPLTGGFVGYLILGYLLGTMSLSQAKVMLAAVVWLIGIVSTILGTYLFTRAAAQFDGFFYEFLNLSVILASGGAFVLIKWLSETKASVSPRMDALTRTFATSAFGIYLVHVIVLEVLSSWIPFLHLNSFMGNTIWSVPLVTTIVFLLSFFIVYLLQKIPVLKLTVP